MESAPPLGTSPLEETAPAAARALDYALNVVLVYQDEQTRSWAEEVCARVGNVVGGEAVRTSWHRIGEFNHVARLSDAVAQARHGDVIVVAIRAADALPFPFYLWADTWLEAGPHETGALVALIGLPDRPDAQTEQSKQYLVALAKRGGLAFMAEERKLAPVSADSPGALAATPGPPADQRPRLRNWGINE